MQKKIFFIAAFIIFLMLFAFRYIQQPVPDKQRLLSKREVFKKRFPVQCSPDWNYLNGDSLTAGIGILEGWGNYRWDIDSKSDSARLYFQQGINMYYSFHLIEAMASFKKAEQFDSTNAMIFWGQALAYGPNINDYEHLSAPQAFSTAQKALSLAAGCSAKEKALIKAMVVRYANDTTTTRELLNQLYTDKMQQAYGQFANDADVAALYVDAMMVQHPWNLWKHNGEALPWTPRLLQVLEKTLRHAPLHPGANHYYIHCVEASANPKRALQSADRLSKLMPSVSHMVHMPSHIYIRSGLYSQGMQVNELSVKGYYQYRAVYPEVVNSAPLYLIHNLHMQAACAMMGAGYSYSAAAADSARTSFDSSYLSLPSPFGEFIQYVYMTPMINDVRFGKWEAILNRPAVPVSYAYANVLWHWARGMAMARKNDIPGAKAALRFVRENKNQPGMLIVLKPFNAAVDAAKVAENLLEGVIAEQENRLPAAVSSFKQAVKNETAMIYNEPKDWILPPGPYLGAALLKAGSFSEAEKVFQEDLKEYPGNHWSVKGLHEALLKQKKSAAPNLIKKQLVEAAGENDLKEMPIVF